MSDSNIEQLRQALEASPDNLILLAMLLRGCLEQQRAADAVTVLQNYEPSALDTVDARVLAARAYIETDDAEAALPYLHGDSAEELIEKARALLALERQAEAREAYSAAVAGNAALEDKGLEARLGAKVTEFEREGRPRLKVYANDNTDDADVVRLLQPDAERITFAAVGGLESVKKTIHKKIILPYLKPSLFQRFRKRVGGGILMYGPPGCGKTLLARATAGECNATFYNIAISDILDMYIGESERKLHAVFETARNNAPAVLFFDEVEAIGGKRQYTRESTSSKLVSQFLSEMDGFAQNNHGVLILAATNIPWAVDPAFRRPGRFDRVLFVPPPDRVAREVILNMLLEERPTQGAMDVVSLARRTRGFSGADLSELVETAADEAIDESIDAGQEIAIQQDHLREALTQVKPTTMEWLTTARNYARYANEGGQYNDVLEFLQKYGKA